MAKNITNPELIKAGEEGQDEPAKQTPSPKKAFVYKGRNPFANDPDYQEMKTVFLPMARAGEQPNAEVRLNGVKWQIPRGKAVDVPRPVYEQFQRKIRNEASEIKLQNAMMASMSPENFGLGYRLGEEPV